MTAAATRAAALLGERLAGAAPLQGGDLSSVMRLRLADGRTAVVKHGPRAAAEADMLRAIRRAGAPAPAVLAVEADLLVLEDLGEDAGLRGAWASLGRALRRLHAHRGDAYGWPVDHAFGAVAIPNAPLPHRPGSWPSFWAERRLLPCLGALPPDLARRVEALARALPDRLPAAPPPALLHGDLWVGNVVARGGTVRGLIDPACYHGHAEVDLAILSLFGTPAQDFAGGYGTPEPGAEARRPIYQLWPALVHLRLSGAGYRGLVEGLLAECGG